MLPFCRVLFDGHAKRALFEIRDVPPESSPTSLRNDGAWFSNLWYLIFLREWDLIQTVLGEPQLNFTTISIPTSTQLLDA